ncbi:stomatin-like protein 1 isoform X2 [Oncorhynchus kisutch]|uniref:stomatin-like protein 1 isoform X2 n=1 Tax=Oncorhynchus kisutch TaxID=8019 RepID=UPI0012DE83B7|nr:stomatin-like protein 1 isoform X2 [Oncorhynchus kisutch]
MYNKASGYQSLPQRDLLTAKPGLFVATESFVQSPFHHHKGHSFDYIPNVRDNDYSDSTQGWLSWICNVIVCFMVYICTFITFPISGWFVLKVVPNYQRIVVFRLGRVRPPKGPGVVLLLPLIDQWQRVDLRTRAFNIPPCQMDINEMTKPWGLEVDRVELTVGAVLKPPEDHSSGPGSVILPPSIPGLEGLAGPIQQLAMHFLGNMAGGNNGAPLVRTEDSISFSDEVSSAPLAISRTGARDEAVTRPMSVLELYEGLLLSESLVSQVGACFLFLLQSPDGQQTSYYVDLSQGSGSAGPGSPPEGQVPDVTLSMTDQDLLAMFEGTLRPFAAYATGRLKVQGDLKTAMKLEEVIKLLRP